MCVLSAKPLYNAILTPNLRVWGGWLFWKVIAIKRKSLWMQSGLLQEETWSFLPTSLLVTMRGHGRELFMCRLSKKLVLDLDIPGCRTWKRKCLCFSSPTPTVYGNLWGQECQGNGAVPFQFIRSRIPASDPQTHIRSVRLFLGKVTSTRCLHWCCYFLLITCCKKVLVTMQIPHFSSDVCALTFAPH